MSGAVSLLKGERKKLRRKEKRARIEQIRVILGLSDSQRTPTVNAAIYYDCFIFSVLLWSNKVHPSDVTVEMFGQLFVARYLKAKSFFINFHFLILKPGESLKDFYKRTNMYWQMAAYEHTEHTGKVTSRCFFYILL
jgi:hypothetical protein